MSGCSVELNFRARLLQIGRVMKTSKLISRSSSPVSRVSSVPAVTTVGASSADVESVSSGAKSKSKSKSKSPSRSIFQRPDGGRAQRNPVHYEAHAHASMKQFAEFLALRYDSDRTCHSYCRWWRICAPTGSSTVIPCCFSLLPVAATVSPANWLGACTRRAIPCLTVRCSV